MPETYKGYKGRILRPSGVPVKVHGKQEKPKTYQGYGGRTLYPSGVPVNVHGTQEKFTDDQPITPEKLVNRKSTVDQPIKKRVEEKPQMEGWQRGLLLGATPMLASLLAGGDLATGAAIGGKALVEGEIRREKTMAEFIKEKREARARANLIDEYRAKKEIDAEFKDDKDVLGEYRGKKEIDAEFGMTEPQKRRYQVVRTYNKEKGITEIEVFDTALGKIVHSEEEILAGFAPQALKNPVTGEHEIYNKSIGKREAFETGSKLEPFFDVTKNTIYQPTADARDKSLKLAESYEKRIGPAEKREDEIEASLLSLKDPNSKILGQKSSLMQVLRLHEKGALSDKDRGFYLTQISKLDSLFEWIGMQKSNSYSPEKVREINTILKRILKVSQKRRKSEAYEAARKLSGAGINKSYALRIISPDHYDEYVREVQEANKEKKKAKEVDVINEYSGGGVSRVQGPNKEKKRAREVDIINEYSGGYVPEAKNTSKLKPVKEMSTEELLKELRGN